MISVFLILVAVMYQRKVGPSQPEIIGAPVMVGLWILFFLFFCFFCFFFCCFFFKLVLWIFTYNISPHFAEIEDHKRKVDTNGFVSEIHQIWKDLMLLDSPNVHPPLKNNQRKKANFKCKWCISLLIEHALNLGSN